MLFVWAALLWEPCWSKSKQLLLFLFVFLNLSLNQLRWINCLEVIYRNIQRTNPLQLNHMAPNISLHNKFQEDEVTNWPNNLGVYLVDCMGEFEVGPLVIPDVDFFKIVCLALLYCYLYQRNIILGILWLMICKGFLKTL